MQQSVNLDASTKAVAGARLNLGGAVLALQQRLCQLDIPVAEDVPYEAIGCIARRR